MADISLELLIIFFLLLGNGLLAMAEIGLVSARRSRLRELADEGDEGAKAALQLSADSTRFLSTVQVGITLIGIIAGVVGGATIAAKFSAWLGQWEAVAAYAEPISFALVIGLLTLASVVLGELVPKRIALHHPEWVARKLSPAVGRLSRLFGPLVDLLAWLSNQVLRPFGLHRNPEAAPVSDEEVNILIEQGFSAGTFNEAEKDMVAGVLELDSLPVTALMEPRPKIVFLNIDQPDEVNWRKIVASGHSHFPVYQTHRDQVLGMVSVKSIWANNAFSIKTKLKDLLQPPLIVPDSMTSFHLLERFKKTGQHIALVADEFGSILGLVTLIDMMEAIVGDLPEQGQKRTPEAHQRDDGSWLMDATLPTVEVKDILDIEEFPDEEDAEYQSLAGFMVTQFGHIPKAGDYFTLLPWRYEVVDMDGRRIDKVMVSPVLPGVPGAPEGPANPSTSSPPEEPGTGVSGR